MTVSRLPRLKGGYQNCKHEPDVYYVSVIANSFFHMTQRVCKRLRLLVFWNRTRVTTMWRNRKNRLWRTKDKPPKLSHPSSAPLFRSCKDRQSVLTKEPSVNPTESQTLCQMNGTHTESIRSHNKVMYLFHFFLFFEH